MPSDSCHSLMYNTSLSHMPVFLMCCSLITSSSSSCHHRNHLPQALFAFHPLHISFRLSLAQRIAHLAWPWLPARPNLLPPRHHHLQSQIPRNHRHHRQLLVSLTDDAESPGSLQSDPLSSSSLVGAEDASLSAPNTDPSDDSLDPSS